MNRSYFRKSKGEKTLSILKEHYVLGPEQLWEFGIWRNLLNDVGIYDQGRRNPRLETWSGARLYT